MKKCELASCRKEFESNSNRQRYCSTRCKRKAATIAGGPDVKRAVEIIPAPKKQPEPKEQVTIVLGEPWVKKIRDFCSAEAIVPEDLITVYKQRVKASGGKEKKVVDTTDQTGGMPRNRMKSNKEPEPGTNAFFLRHGRWK